MNIQETAKIVAQMMLEKVWGNRSFPVDPVWISRQLGIKVMETVLPSDISGALIKQKDKDAIIIVSNTDSPNRKRFSCAHELGHYVSRNKDGKDDKENQEYQYVDLRSNLSSQGTDKEEMFANEFAACLLMPEEEIRSNINKNIPPIILAQQFGVSDDAMNFRLKNLNIK